MSAGVFTPNHRFTLVEKVIGDVGNGTPWPLLVTRDQLAEIMYRVKDAEWTAGMFSLEDTGSGDVYTIATQGAYSTALGEVGDVPGGAFVCRGYFALAPALTEPLPAEPASRFLASYEVAVPHGHNVTFRDIADNECAMWAGNSNFWDAATLDIEILSFGAIGEPTPFRTAFDFLSVAEGTNPGTLYGIYGTEDFGTSFVSEAGLNFSGEVAWVDTDASGNPFSPGNSLYVGMKFATFYVGSPAGPTIRLSTDESFFVGSYADADIDLQIVLASGPLSVNLYAETDYGEAHSTIGSNFVLTATEWWPYAKDSPAVPVWNHLTGARL